VRNWECDSSFDVVERSRTLTKIDSQRKIFDSLSIYHTMREGSILGGNFSGMSTKDRRAVAQPVGLNCGISTLLSAQVIALRSLALALVKEVESFKLDSTMDLEDGISLQSAVRRYEICLIRSALRITNGNQQHASQLLGLKATTLNSKIKRYDILTIPEIRPLGEKPSDKARRART
jgi:hypothetical protein